MVHALQILSDRLAVGGLPKLPSPSHPGLPQTPLLLCGPSLAFRLNLQLPCAQQDTSSRTRKDWPNRTSITSNAREKLGQNPQVCSGHVAGRFLPQDTQHGWSDIAQRTAWLQAYALLLTDQNQGNHVGGVIGMRTARDRINHGFGIA